MEDKKTVNDENEKQKESSQNNDGKSEIKKELEEQNLNKINNYHQQIVTEYQNKKQEIENEENYNLKKIENEYDIEIKKMEIQIKIDEQNCNETLTKFNNIYKEKMKKSENDIEIKRNESNEKIEQIKLEQKKIECEIKKLELEHQKQKDIYERIIIQTERQKEQNKFFHMAKMEKIRQSHELKLIEIKQEYQIKMKQLDIQFDKQEKDKQKMKRELEENLKIIDICQNIDDILKLYSSGILRCNSSFQMNYQQSNLSPPSMNNYNYPLYNYNQYYK